MEINNLTKPELDFYRTYCNFTPSERLLFDERAKGKTMEECTDVIHMEMSGLKRISTKVNRKIDVINKNVDKWKWIRSNY